MTKTEIIKDDITKLEIEAIVNAANEDLQAGGGVDGAIHVAAGPKLQQECNFLNSCLIGEAKLTNAYDLPAKYVIHTVGPVWGGGNKNESKMLKKCYLNSLRLAKEHNIKTIAFPAISAGGFGYPMELAAQVAVPTILEFIEKDDHFEKIVFVLYDDENFNIYQKLCSPKEF